MEDDRLLLYLRRMNLDSFGSCVPIQISTSVTGLRKRIS